jgi:hypothetical protein
VIVRSNGRIDQVLGLSVGEFEQRWYGWLRTTYPGLEQP